MAIKKFPLGREAVAYWNTDGTLVTAPPTGAETWLGLNDAGTPKTIITASAMNLALSLDSTFVPTNTRENLAGGFSSETPVFKNGAVEFNTSWDLNDASLIALIDAWQNDTEMAFGFLNRDKDTTVTDDITNGFVGNFFVSLNKNENTDNIQEATWSLRHSSDGQWYELTHTGP